MTVAVDSHSSKTGTCHTPVGFVGLLGWYSLSFHDENQEQENGLQLCSLGGMKDWMFVVVKSGLFSMV